MVNTVNPDKARHHVKEMKNAYADDIRHSIENSYIIQLDDMSLYNPENC